LSFINISPPQGISLIPLCAVKKQGDNSEASLDEAQKWAKSVGYNENDVNDIV
jgi:S-ribosylhomocysteine lyase LuxS involved in autoinducer biosynthesis